MKKARYALAYAIYFLCLNIASAQITITSPSDRIVFQRDKSDNSIVVIAGYSAECFDKIEARFVPIKSNPAKAELGTPMPIGGGWATIKSTRSCGNFSGSVIVGAGWYRLEVRGINVGKNPISASVQHVGVGDVYLVAGQSNATGGDQNPGGPGALEDAVSSINFRNENADTYTNLKLPCPEFVHLDKNTTTAPFGNYAWCWGYFADRMVEQNNVPVMIFNAGWSATGIENWKQSIPANGITTAWFGARYPEGLPFGHLRIALNNYIAQIGIRAVLWHQGETDNFLGTSRDKYREDLREIIQESRDLSGKPELAWVVARASRYSFGRDGEAPFSRTSEEVLNAQNDVIGIGTHGNDPLYKKNAVFAGPETDPFYDQNYRNDEVHFVGSGLDSLAKFWVKKLDNNFFQTSTPYPAIIPAEVGITQLGSNVTFNAKEGWSQYNWFGQDCIQIQGTSLKMTAGQGVYRLKATDYHNNSVFSPTLYATGNPLPVTWKYFRGTANNNLSADLRWATTEEINASHFEVERANDAVNFYPVHQLQAAGNSSVLKEYSYYDNLPQPGTYYYRIKQMDFDGKKSYSRILSLNIGSKDQVNIFPNPVAESLNIQSETSINAVEIINSTGARVFSSPYQTNSIRLDMSVYTSGIYTVKVNGESFKIVKYAGE